MSRLAMVKRARLAVGATGVVLALAGCSGGGKSTPAAASTAASATTTAAAASGGPASGGPTSDGQGAGAAFGQYQDCLRAHGAPVPTFSPGARRSGSGAPTDGTFSRPPGGFGGSRGPGGFGLGPDASANPSFAAAIQACASVRPSGGVGGGGGRGGRGGGAAGPPNAGRGAGMSLKDRAAATIAAGYRAFRIDGGIGLGGNVFDVHQRVREVAKACKEIREGVGEKGDWTIDFHQKFDFPDALRLCRLIEEYEPYLVEDPTRVEQFLEDIPKLRQLTTCPLAAGEEWGQRWDFNRLVENHDIDYIRATLPNVGGITEMMKVAAVCETHAVGIVPHFTGPIATAALANCLAPYPGPVLFEYNYGERPIDYLPECLDFKQGKLYTNDRPGLGVTVEMKLLKQVGEVTAPIKRQIYNRPDGSLTHW